MAGRPVYVVAVEGLKALDMLDELPGDILRSAKMAINSTLRRATPAAAKQMRREVNFPHGYLSGANGRLQVTRFATDTRLSGTVTGRDRPTSLARFTVGPKKTGGANKRPGVHIEVKPGSAKLLPRAFFIRLRAGGSGAESSNVGVAIRLKPGQRPKKSQGAQQMSNGLWLLYGPSVDQVFYTVRSDIAPDLGAFMEREFTRLLDLNK